MLQKVLLSQAAEYERCQRRQNALDLDSDSRSSLIVDRFSDGEKRDLPLQPKEGMDSIGTVASRSRDR